MDAESGDDDKDRFLFLFLRNTRKSLRGITARRKYQRGTD